MSPNPPTMRPLLLLLPLAAVAALFAWGGTSTPVRADSGEKLVATSVCEAHELKARAEQDPQLEIEIPKEFDKPWPSRAACLAHDAAEDPTTPGPVQPIQFSHKHHAGLYEIDCQYCHVGTGYSPAAGVPSVELCMGCHSQFPKEYDELEGIRTLKQHWEEKRPIEWEQIHRLPEHVQFPHRAHTNAGVDCQRCHGQVQEMDKVYLVEDTHVWPWLLPAQKLEMGWCIDCHRDSGASQDCYACHY